METKVKFFMVSGFINKAKYSDLIIAQLLTEIPFYGHFRLHLYDDKIRWDNMQKKIFPFS